MNQSIINFFARFLRSRHLSRHFHRFVLFEGLLKNTVNSSLQDKFTTKLVNSARVNINELLEILNSHQDGLTESQVEQNLDRYGYNEVAHEKPLPWWIHLWQCYRTPFSLLLTVLATISFLTDDIKATIVISSMVILSTFLRFWQEAKSNKAADALKALVSNTVTVIRRNATERIAEEAKEYFQIKLDTKSTKHLELPIKMLVPGDVILLSAGDMIPADCRLIMSKDLFVSQAAMTGESVPVEKHVALKELDFDNPFDLGNIVFMGTNVISGSAVALVIATGNNTYFGSLAQQVTVSDRAPTSFQAGVNQVSWLLIRFMLVMVPLVMLINGFTKHNWSEALLFALSIAVGLTPEMLPMIVTTTLAKGAVFLSKKKVIVKRLDAIQNFGAMDVLCTDKTGTLTQDKICLAQHIDVWGEQSDEVLEMAYLNSHYQTGLKNLLDVAVLEHAEIHMQLNPAQNYLKIDEIPFDFTRRRMSVVVADRNNQHTLICKGAVEEILAISSHVRHGNISEVITPELQSKIKEITSSLNEQGLRVVAVATKSIASGRHVYEVSDESDLILIGYIAFLDPPKESAAPAIQALADHGVMVKVLTGDNELVTRKVCRDVGLDSQRILLGSDIEKMNDQQLAAAVESANVFAKLTPSHKERIVTALKNNNHVVGFLGDGINDAPALRSADIGISVNSAVDIAKEAADIILLEMSLMVLEQGVLEGRRTFANMLKYIKMTASSNFGNVFSVLVASAFIPFLPMLPMHLLVQNLLYDISQIGIPFDNVDDELLKMPQRWQPADIGRFMLFFGPISSVFDILTFLMMWFVFGANSPEKQTLFQSGWFIVGLMTQTLVVHLIRTSKIPFIQSRASAPLFTMTTMIMLVGIFIPMGPFAHYFKLQSLPSGYFLYLPIILLGYMTFTQLVKSFYKRQYGWQ